MEYVGKYGKGSCEGVWPIGLGAFVCGNLQVAKTLVTLIVPLEALNVDDSWQGVVVSTKEIIFFGENWVVIVL
jgi:hypothetical protein